MGKHKKEEQVHHHHKQPETTDSSSPPESIHPDGSQKISQEPSQSSESASCETSSELQNKEMSSNEGAGVMAYLEELLVKRESQIQELQKEVQELQDKYLRAMAELDNFRKRKAKELEDTKRQTFLWIVQEFLNVIDQFQIAVAAMEKSKDVLSVVEGMKMIRMGFERCFQNLNIEEIPSQVGTQFNPRYHEIVALEHSDTVPVDHIIREYRKGYRLGDTIIRAASVVVSEGPVLQEIPSESEPKSVVTEEASSTEE